MYFFDNNLSKGFNEIFMYLREHPHCRIMNVLCGSILWLIHREKVRSTYLRAYNVFNGQAETSNSMPLL